MNEGRLKFVSTQAKRRRKLTTISNLLIRDKHANYDGLLERERLHVQLMNRKHALPLKRSLVDLRSYSKCLKRKHEEALREHREDTVHFHDDIKMDIEDMIQEHHPRIRRLRKIRRLLETGKSDGQLLSSGEAMGRMDTIMCGNTSTDSRRPTFHRSRSKFVLSPINAYQQSRDLPTHKSLQQLQTSISKVKIADSADSNVHLPPI